jgi:DNA topoisomerase-2
MAKKIEEKYKVLDQISHVLLRPSTYLGSNKPHTSLKWIWDSIEKKMVQKELTIIPSFIKIFDEVITNSVDEHKRNSKLNRIDVIINRELNRITVRDNGGIPVEIHKDQKQYVPEVIFGNLMSGSNYNDDEDRLVAGTNGLGSKLTNIFSKEFTVSTCDGKNHFFQKYSNNMRQRDKPQIKKLTKNHTEVSFCPDLEKFGISEIDDDHLKVIEKRVYDIAGCNPSLKVFLNGSLIDVKSFEDYIRFYTSEVFFETNKDKSWSLGISPSEIGFQQVSFVNSTETYDGGNHVDYILNQIILELRDFFQKKHKVDVKPSELKNHIFLFINSTVVNPSFSSQTKEKLITEVKDFGFTYQVSEKIIKSILKSEIVQSILDWIDQKKLADENKLARNLNKNLDKIKVEKLIDAKGRDRWKCSMAIFEGDSAAGAFRKYRDPNSMGAFSLKGKFMNVSEVNNSKLIQNNEVVNIMAALGLKLGQEVSVKDLRYGRMLFYTDADTDGDSITGLLLNFFNKYWPELFDKKMIYKVQTPIVVSLNRKTKKKILFYTQSEYNDWVSSGVDLKLWEIKYKKGLAALVDDEYNEIINNPKIVLIKKDDLSDKYLDIWFGKSSDLRKDQILN